MKKKVILLKDIKGVGRKNEIVDVSLGFASNYLFKEKVAIEATDEAIKKLNAINKNKTSLEKSQEEKAKKEKEMLEELILVFKEKVSESGRLFGSVTPENIIESIKKKCGIQIDKSQIITEAPIKTTGFFIVKIHLYRNINAQVNINVESI